MRNLIVFLACFTASTAYSQKLNLDSIQWISHFTTMKERHYATGFTYKKDGNSNISKVVCLDKNLKLAWSKTFDTSPMNQFQTLTVRNDTIFATALHGKTTPHTYAAKRFIYLLNAKTGKVLWSIELDKSSAGHSNIVLRGKMLYIAYSKPLSERYSDLAGHQVVLSAVNLTKKTVISTSSKTMFGGPQRLEIFKDKIIALGSYFTSPRDEHSKIFFFKTSINNLKFEEKINTTDEYQSFSSSWLTEGFISTLIHTRPMKGSSGNYKIVKYDLEGNILNTTFISNDVYNFRNPSQGITSDSKGYYIISEKASEKRKYYLLHYDFNGKKISEQPINYNNEFPWRYYSGNDKGYFITNDDNLNHEYFIRYLKP